MLTTPVTIVFKQLEDALMQISNEQYVLSLPVFSGASIGAHSRHIVEVLNELIIGYNTGTVIYDNRKRNKNLETDRAYLVNALNNALEQINRPDKLLVLSVDFNYNNTNSVICGTTYFRELAHVLEHAVHHLALIKIGLLYVQPNINLPAEFGMAAATVKYNNECAL